MTPHDRLVIALAIILALIVADLSLDLRRSHDAITLDSLAAVATVLAGALAWTVRQGRPPDE